MKGTKQCPKCKMIVAGGIASKYFSGSVCKGCTGYFLVEWDLLRVKIGMIRLRDQNGNV